MGNDTSKSTSVGEVIPNDVHIEWKKVATKYGWPASEGQVGCAVNGAIFVFGGVNSVGETNDLMRFDIGEFALGACILFALLFVFGFCLSFVFRKFLDKPCTCSVLTVVSLF